MRRLMRWELALAGVVLATQTVSGQTVNTPQGWPGAAPPPAAAVEPAPKNPTPRPARKKAKPQPVVKVVAVAKPAATEEAPMLTPAPAAPAPAPATVVPRAEVDIVAALQQQSEVLSRLAAELDASRAVVAEQGRVIAALEKKASAAAAVPPPPPAAPAPPPPVITVDTGGAKLRLAGLVQGWFMASDAGVADTFRLRRGEVKLGGDVNRRVRWDLVLDAAKALSVNNSYVTVNGQRVMSDTSVGQSGRMLQDAFLTLTRSSRLAITVGQQKLPLAMEGVQSSSRLETVERALFMSDKARGGTYGNIRDFGVMAKGKVAKRSAGST